MVNAVAQKYPQFFLMLRSNDHRYRSRESPLFLLNIGKARLVRSVDGNAALIDSNELISLGEVVLTQISRADLVGTWNAES
jgi:hypothetical protein